MREILRAIVFCHRIPDDKDFNELINCVPDSRMKDVEKGLRERSEAGFIDTVQIGRHRQEIHPLDVYEDQVDKFFDKIDKCP